MQNGFLALVTLIVALLLGPSHASAQQSVKDKDWNTRFKVSCKLPRAVNGEKPVRVVRVGNDRKLAFTLHEGQVGGCSTDGMARHGAQFWERAEYRQDGYLKLGRAYEISFSVIFQEGFNGKDETFFQIHGWNGDCKAKPPLMVHMDKGRLKVWALRGVSADAGQVFISKSQGGHKAVHNSAVPVSSLIGKETLFRVVFDTRREGLISMYVDGKQVVKNATVEYAPCTKPFIKFGIYRPGGKGSKRSRALFDDLVVKEIQ